VSARSPLTQSTASGHVQFCPRVSSRSPSLGMLHSRPERIPSAPRQRTRQTNANEGTARHAANRVSNCPASLHILSDSAQKVAPPGRSRPPIPWRQIAYKPASRPASRPVAPALVIRAHPAPVADHPPRISGHFRPHGSAAATPGPPRPQVRREPGVAPADAARPALTPLSAGRMLTAE
jgi:hypothetical protein